MLLPWSDAMATCREAALPTSTVEVRSRVYVRRDIGPHVPCSAPAATSPEACWAGRYGWAIRRIGLTKRPSAGGGTPTEGLTKRRTSSSWLIPTLRAAAMPLP